MTDQAQLDAAISALPAAVEAATVTAVETALTPIIEQLEATAAAGGVDLTAEVASLNALAGTVSASVASTVATSLVPAQGSIISGTSPNPIPAPGTPQVTTATENAGQPTPATPTRQPGTVTSTPGTVA